VKFATLVILLLLPVSVESHQWTPTYPELRPSFVDGVRTTKMRLFNKRKDVRYYEIQVLDSEFRPVSFAANEKILFVDYLQTKTVEVYVPNKATRQPLYICTISKQVKQGKTKTMVTSRVCSKTK
jgi:hypothetical protein